MCEACVAGTYQDVKGETACNVCPKGYYCGEGAATPIPCPAGTSSNATGVPGHGYCTPVPIDFWAPLGSAVPEACPPSGFYCPGAAADALYGGAKPIIMPTGGSSRMDVVPAVSKAMTLDMSIDEFASGRDVLVQALASQFGVDQTQISFEASAGSVQLTVSLRLTHAHIRSRFHHFASPMHLLHLVERESHATSASACPSCQSKSLACAFELRECALPRDAGARRLSARPRVQRSNHHGRQPEGQRWCRQ